MSSSSLSLIVLPCYLFLLLLSSCVPASGRLLRLRKPDPDDAAATARWLVSRNSWGVLSTISSDLEGAPFGNVVSFSDGPPGDGHGIPYFYLTTLDPTARDALKDERSSFTLSEFPLGTCGETDPENPTCAKLTLTGKLKLVDSQSTEAEFAQLALFSKHAEMKDWPEDHHFQIFKLDIEDIFLIDWFGGRKPLSPAQYLNPEKNRLLLESQA
ncbi:protein CREG1 [Cocos nucifera]|uniref:Protein CREG1 n=1 Tax=Cocos nucifera TaxID=13894 RepID=A0A8K0HV24_COCNU|nr:protein CREG1 [Cocos nucifera]